MLGNLASMSGLSLFKAVVQFGITTLVALFVLPGEYGLITFSLPIIGFIAVLTDMGLASAIVRQPNLTREQAGGAFSFSFTIGVIAALLLGLTAYPIQHWTGLNHLAPVLIALALAVFFTIVAGVPRAIMERSLRYHRVAMIEGIGTLVAGLACTVSVFLGAGIWSVVLFHVTLQGFRATCFLIESRHAMAINRQWRAITGLLTFGWWVLATNLLNFAARNAQNLLIGAWLGAVAVGLYGLAYQFMILPLMAITWPASGVLLATLSNKANTDDAHFRQPILGVALITALISFPLMIWMTFGLAFPIHTLLAPGWEHMIPLLQVLAPLGAIQSLSSYNGAVLLARGHSSLQFWINLITSAVLLVGFLFALPHGVQRFAEVYFIVGMATALFQIAAKLWAAKIPAAAYLWTLTPPIAATATGYAAAWMIGLRSSDWLHWAGVTAGYGVAVLAVYALSSRKILRELQALLRSRATAGEAATDYHEPLG